MAHISVISKRDLDSIRHKATRERKQREKLQRMAVDEANRVEVDKQENDLREKNRRKQIERANRILFDATDKVKAYHGKLLMSDVIQEREAQIKHKKHVSELLRAQDEVFHQSMMKAIEVAEDAELQKMREQYRLAKQQQEDRMTQLDILKARLLAERENNVKEGKRLSLMAVEEEEEIRLKEIREREKAKQAYEETLQANRALHVFKLKELEREKLSDKAIIEYSRRRESMMEKRIKREVERAELKEERKAKMMDHMEKNYVEAQAKAEARVAKNIEDCSKKKMMEEESTRAAKISEIESIHKSRQQQIYLKKEKQLKCLQEEQEAVKAWKARTDALEAEEKRKKDQLWQAGQLNRSYLDHQVKVKEEKRARDAREEAEVAAMLQTSLDDESNRFKEYATMCTEEWGKSNKSTQPMDLYMTAKQRIESI